MKKNRLDMFIAHCSDLLTDYKPHGDGLIAYGFIKSLARRGHNLHVAAQQVALRDPVPDNVTIYPISTRKPHGISTRLEYMVKVRQLFNRLNREHHFDLIHQLNPVFSGLSLSLVGTKVPIVLGPYVGSWPVDVDGIIGGSAWKKKMMLLGKDVIASAQQERASALVLTTMAAADRLPKAERLRDRIHIVSHGIDSDLFSPAPDWDSPARMRAEQENPSILFFANVWKRKGIFTLLKAYDIIHEKLPNVRLVIGGNGPEMPRVRELAAASPASSKIEFIGAKLRTEAPALYRDCSVYCLPSFGEPFGMTALEAMSCARPLVVTDAGGLGHLVRDEGGRRVPVDNPEKLAAALIELLQDPEKRVRMGRFNRALVEKNMKWEVVAEQLEQVYDIVLNQKRNEAAKTYLVDASLQPPA